jgi:hypothetical protein
MGGPSLVAINGIVHAPSTTPAMNPESRDALLDAGALDKLRGLAALRQPLAERPIALEVHSRLIASRRVPYCSAYSKTQTRPRVERAPVPALWLGKAPIKSDPCRQPDAVSSCCCLPLRGDPSVERSRCNCVKSPSGR